MPRGKNKLAGNTIKTGKTNPSTNKTKFTQYQLILKLFYHSLCQIRPFIYVVRNFKLCQSYFCQVLVTLI